MSGTFDFLLLRRKALTVMQWATILIGLSVPISVALDNVLLALLLAGAVLNLGSILHTVRVQPVARAAILLFAMLLAATFYGITPWRAAFATLSKYIDLILIPIFMVLLADKAIRHKARHAFLAAMALTLVLSYMLGMGLLPMLSWMNPFSTTGNPVIFHSHITQNNMMAFAVLLALLEARDATTRGKKFAWAMFAMLGTINVLFMVQGRTGYLILLALLGWFAWATLIHILRKHGREWGWRLGLAIVAAITTMALAAYHLSPRLHDRVMQVASEYQAWTPGHGKLTSTGQRLDFYSSTLQIVQQHPLFGVGTGGFAAVYAQQTQGMDVMKTQNPHNEYLMIMVQSGVIGLALLLYLFYTQWHYAPLLPTTLEQDAGRGLMLAYAINCVLNSALLDHADGLLFAFMTAVLFAGQGRKAQHG